MRIIVRPAASAKRAQRSSESGGPKRIAQAPEAGQLFAGRVQRVFERVGQRAAAWRLLATARGRRFVEHEVRQRDEAAAIDAPRHLGGRVGEHVERDGRNFEQRRFEHRRPGGDRGRIGGGQRFARRAHERAPAAANAAAADLRTPHARSYRPPPARAVIAGRRSRNSASALSKRGVWRAISPARLPGKQRDHAAVGRRRAAAAGAARSSRPADDRRS